MTDKPFDTDPDVLLALGYLLACTSSAADKDPKGREFGRRCIWVVATALGYQHTSDHMRQLEREFNPPRLAPDEGPTG
jgi:hypothetical protein